MRRKNLWPSKTEQMPSGSRHGHAATMSETRSAEAV